MFRDVRMRGFRERAPVRQAQAWIDALTLPQTGLGARVESVNLADAAGRLLACDLHASRDVPAFDRSAMDGWALRAEATFGAGRDDPIAFEVIGTARAGRPFPGPLGPQQAVRIMTGAPLPAGADAVLPAEEGREQQGRLEAYQALAPQRHVSRVGEDVRRGTRVLAAGRRLRPQDVGLAAALGATQLSVRTRPSVSVLITGDEILPLGAVDREACIPDANGPMLRALLQRDGATVAQWRYVPDGREALRNALKDAPGDILLISGGSSVGEEDHAPGLVAELGTLAFHGLALRPASPAGMGQIEGRPVFLQPGHPVSCLCAYDLLAGRLVRRLATGRPQWSYPEVRAQLTRKLSSPLGRMDYARVCFVAAGIEPLMSRGASILSSATQADGFVLVPPESEGYAAGETVTAYAYDPDAAARST